MSSHCGSKGRGISFFEIEENPLNILGMSYLAFNRLTTLNNGEFSLFLVRGGPRDALPSLGSKKGCLQPSVNYPTLMLLLPHMYLPYCLPPNGCFLT